MKRRNSDHKGITIPYKNLFPFVAYLPYIYIYIYIYIYTHFQLFNTNCTSQIVCTIIVTCSACNFCLS